MGTELPGALGLPGPAGGEDPDSHVLLHRDLHPQNVILTSAGPVIIDWEGAARGPALYDVAMTWVIVGFSDVPETGLGGVAVRGAWLRGSAVSRTGMGGRGQGRLGRSRYRSSGAAKPNWR